MKFKLFPVPHITIWNFWISDLNDNILENHYFLTRRGARKFMKKYSDKLIYEEDCQCGYGGEPLWFW
jgi:hypothetical protein